MSSFIVFHPLQLPARWDLSRPHISKGITWNNKLARLSISFAETPTLDMKGF
jgi:hypothetical protein